MTTLSKEDLRFIVTRLPRDLREIMKTSMLFVGGGFIRETIAGGTISDIDVFGSSVELLKATAIILGAKREGSRQHETDNAITLLTQNRFPVQFIKRWVFPDAETLIKSFDFTVCQSAIWWDAINKEWVSAISDSFYQDLAARRLVYTFPIRDEDAGGSMLRARKFIARGYNIQAPSLAGVISRLALAVDFNKTGTDERRIATAICGLLREVDPMIAIDGLDIVDEHETIEGIKL